LSGLSVNLQRQAQFSQASGLGSSRRSLGVKQPPGFAISPFKLFSVHTPGQESLPFLSGAKKRGMRKSSNKLDRSRTLNVVAAELVQKART
jgi:hypothetical protein